MEIFLTSISGILVILGMILVGFVMGEKGWFDDKSRGLIAKLVTQIALPCYMLYTITQRFTAADLLKMLPELRFPTLSMVILLGIATAVARIFAVKKERRGLFISMFLIRIPFLWGSLSIKPSLATLVSLMFLSIICAIRPFSGPWGPTSSNVMGKETLNLI